MPITVDVLPGGGVVYARVGGPSLTHEQLLEYTRVLCEDPRIRPGFKELFDAREVEETDVGDETAAEINRMRLSASDRMRGVRTAIVTMHPEAYKLQYLFAWGTGSFVTFADIKVARTWLGVDSPENP